MAIYWSGEHERGRNILKSVRERGTLRKNAMLAADYALRGEFEKAYEEKAYIDTLLTPIIRKSFNNTITSNIDAYFSVQQQVDRLELEQLRLRTILGLVVIGVILLSGVSMAVARHRRQRREIDRKVIIAEELQDALERTQYNYTHIQSEYEHLQSERELLKSQNDNLRERCRHLQSECNQIHDDYKKIESTCKKMQDEDEKVVCSEDRRVLFKGRFEMLEVLTEMVTKYRDKKGGRQKIADYITELVMSFSDNEDRIKEMEICVDTVFNNLMTEFKETFPGRKPADYRLFLFSVMGLSNTTIAEFLKEECLEPVYTRRKRLKKLIRQAPESIQNRFLPYF